MEPLFKKIDQLGLVVQDLPKCLALLCDTYGIGPWNVVKFGGEDGIPISDVELFGEAVEPYEILCATCDLPDGMQLELIQPLAGKSIFQTYLDAHGPGLQHLSVVVDDFDAAMARLKEAGRDRGQKAMVDGQELCIFANQPGFCLSLELHKRGPDFHFPDYKPAVYPAGGMPEGAVPLFTSIDQIGFVTSNLDAVLRELWEKLGLGPWMLLNFGELGENSVSVENVLLDGEPVSHFGQRVAICEALNIQLEHIHPVIPQGMLYRHILLHGTDAQHLSVVTSQSYEQASKRIHKAGFKKGQVCTIDGTETCLYADHTELLGLSLELHKRPDPFIPPQVTLETYPEGFEAAWKK